MNAWKYEIISPVEQDILDIRNKFLISAHPCIILYLYKVPFWISCFVHNSA